MFSFLHHRRSSVFEVKVGINERRTDGEGQNRTVLILHVLYGMGNKCTRNHVGCVGDCEPLRVHV